MTAAAADDGRLFAVEPLPEAPPGEAPGGITGGAATDVRLSWPACVAIDLP